MNKKINILNPINFFAGVLAVAIFVFFQGVFASSGGISALTSFFQFALITIICTAGISLLLWIPILSLLGAIVTGIIGLFFKKKFSLLSNSTDSGPIKKESNNELAIIGYIVSSRNTGTMTDTAIKANLKSGGWNEKDIEEAFKKSTSRT